MAMRGDNEPLPTGFPRGLLSEDEARMQGEIETLRAEVARLTRERDAYLSGLVWPNTGDDGWWAMARNPENPGQYTKEGQSLFRTREQAVAAMNKELGLDQS